MTPLDEFFFLDEFSKIATLIGISMNILLACYIWGIMILVFRYKEGGKLRWRLLVASLVYSFTFIADFPTVIQSAALPAEEARLNFYIWNTLHPISWGSALKATAITFIMIGIYHFMLSTLFTKNSTVKVTDSIAKYVKVMFGKEDSSK